MEIRPTFCAGSELDPPLISVVALISGNSWSSCKKMTMPFGNWIRVGSCGLKLDNGGIGTCCHPCWARRSPQAETIIHPISRHLASTLLLGVDVGSGIFRV